MKIRSYRIRLIFLGLSFLLLVFMCIAQLFRIQIVNGDIYLSQATVTHSAKQPVEAARGQIFDVNGVPLNTNRSVYKLVLQRAFLTVGKENDTIARAIEILQKNDEKWVDNMPITMTEPYAFNKNDDEVEKFKSKLGMNLDATPRNCLDWLFEQYKISADLPRDVQRIIAGVRYEMKVKDFSNENRYVMAEDIRLKTIIELKELWSEMPGIDIIEGNTRVYDTPDLLPHVRGVISPISPEEYAERKKDGYKFTDYVGSFGIEKGAEDTLRGADGVREIIRNNNGEAVQDETTQNVQPGQSVRLTVNSAFQRDIQDILHNHMSWFRTNTVRARPGKTAAGSVVVLNPKTGAVLAMASEPTYDLTTYKEDYASILAVPNQPTLNRTVMGLYRPGSTFKTITGTTALMDGVIGRNDTIYCSGVYTFWSGYRPGCTAPHDTRNIIKALQWSCNTFFYDTGRRTGIDRLAVVAGKFGIGTDLGLEIGGLAGHMTTPELFEKLREKTGEKWTPGNVAQAAIGQSETLVTPLHLAVQAMTLANDGVRYQPYLIDSVWDYDGKTLLKQTEPVVAEDISAGNENTFSIIREGMIAVSTLVDWPIGSGAKIWDGLPDNIAMKTGSPETGSWENGRKIYNSAVIAYYPAHDPQIAIGVMIEDSDYSRYILRNIIDAYFYHNYTPAVDANGIITTPWKRWIGQREPDTADKVDETAAYNGNDGDVHDHIDQ